MPNKTMRSLLFIPLGVFAGAKSISPLDKSTCSSPTVNVPLPLIM
jgi:hypothetical protein